MKVGLKTSAYFLLVLCLVGCDKLPFFKNTAPKPKADTTKFEVHGTLIAKVNNLPVTLEELNAQVENFNNLAEQQGRPQDKIDTRDKKIKYLREEILRQKLLYKEALDRGLDKKEDFQKALDSLKSTLLIQSLINEELNKVNVTSSEIEEYYNRFKDQLREPEERKISEIVTNTEQEAKQVVISYLQGEDFAALARKYSKATSAAQGGDLGYLKIDVPEKRIRFDKFYEVAFGPLEVGQVSSPFKGPDGWYVIKLEAKKEGKQKKLEDMWDEIKTGLLFLKQQQRIEELITKLQRQAQIEVYEDKVY